MLILWWLYRASKLQFVLRSLSCSIFFFSSLAKSRYLSFFSFSFSFTLRTAGTAMSTVWKDLFFFWLSLSLVVWQRSDDPFLSQNYKEYCVSFSRTDSGLCIYHLFVWSNSNFCLHSLSTSSLGRKALCITMSFLVLWFISWSSFLVHFKNSPELLTRVTAQVFIHLIKLIISSSIPLRVCFFYISMNCWFSAEVE